MQYSRSERETRETCGKDGTCREVLSFEFWVLSYRRIRKPRRTREAGGARGRGFQNFEPPPSAFSLRPFVFSDRRKVANNDLGNFLKIAVRCQDREPVMHILLHGTGLLKQMRLRGGGEQRSSEFWVLSWPETLR